MAGKEEIIESIEENLPRRLIAERIADVLMTNGAGQKAERLALELSGRRDGGGWGRDGLITAVEEVLRNAGVYS